MTTTSIRCQVEQLREIGYVVAAGFVPADRLAELNRCAQRELRSRTPPLELEATLSYPGAPSSPDAEGGSTVRRLLDAYHRSPTFAELALMPEVHEWMRSYFGESVSMSVVHHNCLMTKHPRYGSITGWHRDIRYWSFTHADLVSAWFALGEENPANGALTFVPGSHLLQLEDDRFDPAKFFRTDYPANGSLLATAHSPRLAAGDAVFFHCNTLHSAGQNNSSQVKMSLVFTYHGRSTRPIPGTRSAAKSEIEL